MVQETTAMEENREILDLEEQLRAHSAHFAAMVELIPAKHYVSRENEAMEDSKYWVNKKKARKQSGKEAAKKAKRLKLDPEKGKSVVELQAEVNKQEEEIKTEAQLTPLPNKSIINGFSVEHVQSTSLSDLQERLKEKIKTLRRKRNAPEDEESVPRSKEVSQKRQKRMEKRQRKKELRKKLVRGGATGIANGSKTAATPTKPSFKDKETGRIVFSKFDFTTPVQSEQPNRVKGKDYKKLLAKAEAAQKKLEELKQKDEKRGEELEKKLKWQKALDMARGTKLHDDPKRLKKTFKRMEKKKQKSSKAWEERKAAEQQSKEKRQQKRQRNIQERKDKIKATKMKKRAKKGGIRKPGF